MKQVLAIFAILSLSVSTYGYSSGDSKYFHSSFSNNGYAIDYYDHNDDNNAGGYTNSRATHYCWVNDESGGAIDKKFFGTWLDVPRAQGNAIKNCMKSRDEGYWGLLDWWWVFSKIKIGT